MHKDTWMTRAVLLIGLAAAWLCAFACGGMSPSDAKAGVTSTLRPGAAPGTTYLYVGGATRSVANLLLVGSVLQFRVNGDGTLSALTPAAVSTGTVLPSWGMTVTPSNQHLLLLNGSIAEFAIGQGGTLTATSAPATTGNSIVFTPDGKFAIIANSANSTLTSYSVGSSDALTQINTAATGGYPQIAVVDNSEKFAYVSNLDDGSVSEYTISAGGVLATNGFVASGGNAPRPLAISPGGFLYCANTNSPSVSEFSINASTGALTLINTYTVGLGEPLDTGPLWISFDPTGKNAYIGTLAEIDQFTVVTAGAAIETLSSNGTVADAHGDLWGRVDPSGRFVFSVGADSTVSGYIISSAGMLTPNGSVFLGANLSAQALAFAQQ